MVQHDSTVVIEPLQETHLFRAQLLIKAKLAILRTDVPSSYYSC
jgi:hypothetical protein